jgi:hypothetical protein
MDAAADAGTAEQQAHCHVLPGGLLRLEQVVAGLLRWQGWHAGRRHPARADPANPNPTPVVTVNPTPVTVTAPPASANAGANAVANDRCSSKRVIHFSWPKGDKKTHIRFWNKTAKGKMSNGRMRATADFRGYQASRGDLLKVTQLSRRHGHNVSVQRVFKAC